jgi:hypothetical protein
MKRVNLLKKRQARLKEQIYDNLDLLVGTVGKSPSMKYHNLTNKVNGKTVSKHVTDDLAPKVKKMVKRHKKVKSLIFKLAEVNWELLKFEFNKIDEHKSVATGPLSGIVEPSP